LFGGNADAGVREAEDAVLARSVRGTVVTLRVSSSTIRNWSAAASRCPCRPDGIEVVGEAADGLTAIVETRRSSRTWS